MRDRVRPIGGRFASLLCCCGELNRRPTCNEGKTRVILWPDTFNNFFHPETAKAAVEVLEDAGFQIVVPNSDLCCGRPLYDYGMLDTAKRWLDKILIVLQSEIQAGTSVIGLEPSCTTVFRDELLELFPQNEDALRLSRQTFTLAEFLEKRAANYQPPKLLRKALIHGHCHHKSVIKFDCDQELLKRIGLDMQIPDSGCCGMAGAFGFEKRTLRRFGRMRENGNIEAGGGRNDRRNAFYIWRRVRLSLARLSCRRKETGSGMEPDCERGVKRRFLSFFLFMARNLRMRRDEQVRLIYRSQEPQERISSWCTRCAYESGLKHLNASLSTVHGEKSEIWTQKLKLSLLLGRQPA